MPKTSQKFALENGLDTPITVALEPWGMRHEVPGKSTIEIVYSFDQPGNIESSIDSDELIIWLWQTCSAVVLIDRVEVSSHDPVPATPDGMSVRQFMGLLGLSDIKS